MQLTTKSEYCLLAMIYMARKQDQGYVKLDDICTYYDIPKKYLEQLFYILKQNRYIQTRRGSSGGYKLAKRPDQITVAEVVRLLDGALAPVESVSRYFYSATPLQKEERMIALFRQVRDFIAQLLENTTFQDLV